MSLFKSQHHTYTNNTQESLRRAEEEKQRRLAREQHEKEEQIKRDQVQEEEQPEPEAEVSQIVKMGCGSNFPVGNVG